MLTPKIIVGPVSELRRLRREHTDRLLTLLAILFFIEIFVFAPLQAEGIFLFQGFAIAALLAIIGAMLVISDSPRALAVMSVCFAANVVVFLIRLLYTVHHMHTRATRFTDCNDHPVLLLNGRDWHSLRQ
jgi:hypothetical protein